MKQCPDCPTFFLKEMPHEIHDIILEKQFQEKKIRKNSNGKSLEKVIYTIIKEWRDLKTKGVLIETDNMNLLVKNEITKEERTYIINEINKRMG